MIYNLNKICTVNGSYLTDELNEAFKPWQTGEPDRKVPLVYPGKQVDPDNIVIDTQEAGVKFLVEFNEYSAQLMDSDYNVICAGSIDNGEIDFEHEFAAACVKAIKEWW